jgi:protocatechuate 3,4-dioxygenase, beta subunit
MNHLARRISRRSFITTSSLSVAALMTPGVLAEELERTATQTEGPFYPDKLPLDTDNDLLVINDGITPAVGDVTYLSGRVLDANSNPIMGAVVEIWQCDSNGVYLHTGDSGRKKDQQDANFQGFGRFITGSSGEYLFRTIKPVPYAGRTPHIHFKVKRGGRELLTTQCYIRGHELNQRDGIYRRTGAAVETLLVDFKPVKDSRFSELAAKFDIVLDRTPAG